MAEEKSTQDIMSKVTFETDENVICWEQSPSIERKIMKCSFGLIKSERQAKIILLVFVAILFYATIAIGINTGNKNNTPDDARRVIIEKMRSK